MNKNLIYGMLLCLLGSTTASCSDDEEIFFENLIGEEDIEVVHPNTRDKPYPREEHELYLNPAPLIVPTSVKDKDDFLEFELSQDSTFTSESTHRSGQVEWYMYNIHEQMAPGTWYWRFHVVDTDGTVGPWSEVNKFTVTGKEPVFVTPAWDDVVANIPTTYPRIHYYLNEDLERVRPTITGHEEYDDLLSRVRGAMNYTASVSDLYDDGKANSLAVNAFDYLYSTYLLTGDEQYRNKLLEYGHAVANGIQNDKLFNSNFHSAYVVNALSTIYDACQDGLSEQEKTTIEEAIVHVLNHYYESYKGSQENHVFDNHTWQIVLRALFQGAFVVCQEYPDAMKALEYFYELWTARAPASGFNRDGGWINGTGYFNTNSYTLYYMPMLLSRLTGTNFLAHPWYQNVGRALVYSWLPGTATTGFGDIGNPTEEPYRTRIAFADFIASELGDANAAWYVKECNKTTAGYSYTLQNDYSFRLYRMARSKYPYGDVADPDQFEDFIWYRDMGEGVAYSDMLDRGNNMSLAFRSSPFGSGSHTLADQNSFKLLYKGVYVYMNAGYYQNFADAHNLLQFRNTRGHNTIMINNIGQPFTTRAYGNIPRALNGRHIAYFLGDASHAYCGTSEYTLWQNAFANAGLSQTPEYGFGETPLNNYKRHIFMLRPNKVVIYDDLGADEPATWQWLLHSPVEFNIAGNKITTHYTDKGGFTSVAQIYSNQTPEITKTNEWFPGGEPDKPADVAKQWHLTADFPACQNNRILTIIQVSDDGVVEDVWQVNNTFTVGDWTIEAEMDADKPAAITIKDATNGCVFSYGADAVIDGSVYQRQQEGSSLLYDEVGGSMQVQEIADKPVQTTRSLH